MNLTDLQEALRLQEQSSSSNLSQLLECRRLLDLSRSRCQLLEQSAQEAESEDDQAVILAALEEERQRLEIFSFDYLMLLEDERQWSLMHVKCFHEMAFPKEGVWRTFFSEAFEEEDLTFRKRIQEQRDLAEAVKMRRIEEEIGGEEE